MNGLAHTKKRFLKELGSQRILLVLIVLFVLMSLSINNFAKLENIMKIARQTAVYGIIAVGMTFVIMTGGIDISVGSTVALGSVVAGMLNINGFALPLCLVCAVVTGLLVGAANGFLVAYCRVLPFVATLGMLNVIRALALITTNGKAVWGMSESMLGISAGFLWFVPMPVAVMICVFLAGDVIMRHFSLGRFFLAVGGNRESARLAGVSTRIVEMSAYVICGGLSGLAGVVLASRLGTAQPSVGGGYELIVIASVVIGGTSLLGGTGSMIGTLWGTLLLGLVSSALNQLGVQSFYQTLVTGLIVIMAVLFDVMKKDK